MNHHAVAPRGAKRRGASPRRAASSALPRVRVFRLRSPRLSSSRPAEPLSPRARSFYLPGRISCLLGPRPLPSASTFSVFPAPSLRLPLSPAVCGVSFAAAASCQGRQRPHARGLSSAGGGPSQPFLPARTLVFFAPLRGTAFSALSPADIPGALAPPKAARLPDSPLGEAATRGWGQGAALHLHFRARVFRLPGLRSLAARSHSPHFPAPASACRFRPPPPPCPLRRDCVPLLPPAGAAETARTGPVSWRVGPSPMPTP